MHLIDARTLMIGNFTLEAKPSYAILSHTWGDSEVSFQDFCEGRPLPGQGYEKILKTCELALEYGLSYVWVDTCCIDKTNSAELSEAINSMYQWYKNSEICFAYLSDLAGTDVDQLFGCRWWSRGWTLQELIAPRKLIFLNREWLEIGDKLKLKWKIESRIDCPYISGEDELSQYSVARRMSWAAQRVTTRPEDEAYCLLGIFDINMPLIYGEGRNAFRRLQEEIIKRSNDLTIFAFEPHVDHPSHFLAIATSQFLDALFIPHSQWSLAEFTLTNRGLNMVNVPLLLFWVKSRSEYIYVIKLDHLHHYYLPLTMIGPNTFVRHPMYSIFDDGLLPSQYVKAVPIGEANNICLTSNPGESYGRTIRRLYLPSPSYLSLSRCSPPSLIDQETHSIILGSSTIEYLANLVLALRWNSGNESLLLVYTQVDLAPSSSTRGQFLLLDDRDDLSEFFFDERSESSVTRNSLLRRSIKYTSEPLLPVPANPVSLHLGGLPVDFKWKHTHRFSEYHDFTLRSGKWRVFHQSRTDDASIGIELRIAKVIC